MLPGIIKLGLYLFTLLCISPLFAQLPGHISNRVTGEEFNAKQFAPSKRAITDLAGDYHFGESEGEWDLVIIPYGDSFIVQASWGSWAGMRWRMHYRTFNRAYMREGKLFFGPFTAFFADFNYNKTFDRTLLLNGDPQTGEKYTRDTADVGFYTAGVDSFFSSGEMSELSRSVLPEAYFSGKTKAELKIMRNTIYAGYGFIFQKGSDMDKYFKKKDWYDPYLKDVSKCLTTIELKNIETISKLERQ